MDPVAEVAALREQITRLVNDLYFARTTAFRMGFRAGVVCTGGDPDDPALLDACTTRADAYTLTPIGLSAIPGPPRA